MNETLTTDLRIGELAAAHPLATRVFARHGIDFCCGGGRPLGDVCAENGLDPTRILSEIEREIASPDHDARRWNDAPLADLIDHIVTTFHRPLQEELPRLDAMAEKVARVHGDKDPERLAELVDVYHALRSELEDHMMKEEVILFPMIQQGAGRHAEAPMAVMLREHDDAGTALRRLRELTDDYTPPPFACNTWRALFAGLHALETEMHEHIHLENNILFPRARAGA